MIANSRKAYSANLCIKVNIVKTITLVITKNRPDARPVTKTCSSPQWERFCNSTTAPTNAIEEKKRVPPKKYPSS